MEKNTAICMKLIETGDAKLSQRCIVNCYAGICNDCWYYSTWNGKGWCDRANHFIEDDNIEKGCYVSR